LDENFQGIRLSFNYVSFCKYFVYLIVPVCDLANHKPELLEQELYKLFISECSSIKYLGVGLLNYPIHDFPGANNWFSNLRELSCMTSQPSSHFYGLGQICRSIEKISVYLFSENVGLAKLIEMQKQIKYVNISSCCVNTEFGMVIQALEKHAHFNI
jgi:hypothetical protein